MNIRVGLIPYLNMVPFHQGFGPEPLDLYPRRFEFKTLSPRALGLEAEKGAIDAGAMSIVDWLRLSTHYEPIGFYGIGVKRSANSVLLFSKAVMGSLEGATIAVTDETSTSFRLLQVLLEGRYGLRRVRYGRIASSNLFDGGADAALLIGDEALKARRRGVKGLPLVTDLGEEWYAWQQLPFVFARWVVRQALATDIKDAIERAIEKSLCSVGFNAAPASDIAAAQRGLDPQDVRAYWDGFAYRLTPAHLESLARFEQLMEKQCLIA